MSRVETLLGSLKENVARIDAANKRIKELQSRKDLTREDEGLLQILYRNEFSLHMDNSSIYRKLMDELAQENEFTQKRIATQARKLLRAELMDV